MHQPTRHNAFNSIELVITLVILAMMATVLTPTLSSMRSQMRGLSSEANLILIAQASASYAQDNDDRIFSFTWRAGVPYINLATGKMKTSFSDTQAAARQVQNILHRATGRLNGPGKILIPSSRLVHRRYTHLVLADYLGGIVSSPIWADPADANLIRWQLEQPMTPQDYSDSGVPYANGLPASPGYVDDGSWASNAIRQLWPFASSYQAVPHAWQPDFGPQYDRTDPPSLLR